MTAPEEELAGDALLACPRCASTVDGRQEYCLECGLRLPREDPERLRPAGAAREAGGGWKLPAVVALVVAALGGALGVAVSGAGGGEAAVSTAIGGSRTVTEADPVPAPPEPTAATTTAPPTRTAPPVSTPQRPPAAITWPAGRRAWTIVLLSVPQTAGRAAAEARAVEARRRGLRNVGVLNSSRFASLHPGYFVVFTGVFDSEAEAVGALPRPRSVFRGAYQREIVP